MSQAGDLVGIQDLPATGRNLEVKLYLVGGLEQERNEDGGLPATTETSIRLALQTEGRPGLVLVVTLNTDFAQVEVDDEQVKLTRFGLFFPEKRDFFLENSGIFDFGVQGNPFEPPQFQMFFSRQIGIEEDEEEVVPTLGGARLTGRVGGQTVGFLTVATDEVKDLADSLVVAPGTSDAGLAMLMFNTSQSRPISLEGNLRTGNFYGGSILSMGGNLRLAPRPGLHWGWVSTGIE